MRLSRLEILILNSWSWFARKTKIGHRKTGRNRCPKIVDKILDKAYGPPVH